MCIIFCPKELSIVTNIKIYVSVQVHIVVYACLEKHCLTLQVNILHHADMLHIYSMALRTSVAREQLNLSLNLS